MSRPSSAVRRVLRRCLRVTLRVLVVVLVVAFGVPLVDGLLPLPGRIAPPALVTRHRGQLPGPALGAGYPKGSVVARVPVGGGDELVGMFLPSDEGAPVVLHLLGSGGSLMDTRLRRPVFDDLAAMGFASLLLDWNGVGASDGPGDVRLLRRDVLAMFREAAARAGGAGRVLVRATSLGSLAAAMLLEEGLEPAGLVLVAPVRSETASAHWTRFFFGSLAWWLSEPWLLPLADVDLLAALGATRVPVLALTTSTDVLLPEAERGLLARVLEGGRGALVLDPEYHSDIRGLRIWGLLGRRMSRAESSHFVQAVQARALFVDEVAFLEDLFAERTARARVQRWLEQRGEDAPAVPPDLDLALANLLTQPHPGQEHELDVALRTPHARESLQLLHVLEHDGVWPDDDLLHAWLDVSDPAGNLRVDDVRDIHAQWAASPELAATPPQARLDLALWGLGLAQVTASADEDLDEPVVATRLEAGAVASMPLQDERARAAERSRAEALAHWREVCRSVWTTALVLDERVVDARRKALRTLLKALALAERVAPDGDPERDLQVYVDGRWEPIDLAAALPDLDTERVRASALWREAREQAAERQRALDAGESVDEISLGLDDLGT